MGYDAFYQIISDLEDEKDINTLEEFRDVIENAINEITSSERKFDDKCDISGINIVNNTNYHTNDLFSLYKLKNKIWGGKIVFDNVYEYYDKRGNECSWCLTRLFDILMNPKSDKIFLQIKYNVLEKSSLEYVRLIDLNNQLDSDLTIYVDETVVVQNRTTDLLAMGSPIALFHYDRHTENITEILNLLGNKNPSKISTLLNDYKKPEYLDESEHCYRIKSISNPVMRLISYDRVVSWDSDLTEYHPLDLDDEANRIHTATVELEFKS
jgi:hypothetical protein